MKGLLKGYLFEISISQFQDIWGMGKENEAQKNNFLKVMRIFLKKVIRVK